MMEVEKVRFYSSWSGDKKGVPEDVTRCIEEVPSNGSWIPYQCRRKRGHGPDGLYCKQHGEKEQKHLEQERRMKELQ